MSIKIVYLDMHSYVRASTAKCNFITLEDALHWKMPYTVWVFIYKHDLMNIQNLKNQSEKKYKDKNY